MSKSSRHVFWVRFLISLLCLGFLANLVVFLALSGIFDHVKLFSVLEPTSTIVGFEMISLTPATPTPFQPLPTQTPTPTATLTPTPTATFTSMPTNTPPPTSTPLPPPTQLPFRPLPDGLPSSAQVSGLIGYDQSHLLSCESRSAVDWAAYYGVSINENTFQANLPLSGDPDSGFVGNPDDAEGQLPPNSYGVHADPVAAGLRAYGLNASAVHGISYDDLRRQIASGHPVIVWVYGNVWSGGVPVAYTASNGHTSTVIAFEHTVIVTGYDGTYVTIVDGAMVYIRIISQFKNSWATLGNMAVVLQ